MHRVGIFIFIRNLTKCLFLQILQIFEPGSCLENAKKLKIHTNIF